MHPQVGAVASNSTFESAGAELERAPRLRFSPGALLVAHGAVWLTGSVSLWLAWTGFVASDDSYYVNAARGWLHHFPYVAHSIGTARFVVALPISGMFALFGDSEFTAVLSSCLFLLATASLTLVMLMPHVGLRNAATASTALMTVPLFALKSTIPSADLPELFFALLSLWLFLRAWERPRRLLILLLAGGSAALAFLAHETSAALLVFYGLLFIAGKGIRRREYWIMAAAFVLVIAAECAYYWIAAGNPLHRLALLARAAASTGDRVQVDFLQIAAGGTIHVWTPIDPLLMFFTKQEFALLGVVTVPAMFWALRGTDATPPPHHAFARLVGLLGIVWFIFVAIVLNRLILLPRYYMVPAYCFFVVSAIWAATVVKPRHPRGAAALLILFVASNLVAVDVDNKNPRFGERALVDYLRHSTGVVYTDPYTAYYTDSYAQWGSVDYNRIKAGSPAPGFPYFYNPPNVDHANRFVPSDALKEYAPPTSWKVVWRKQEAPKALGVILRKLKLLDRLPRGIARKLLSPNPAVAVYKARPDLQP